MGSLRTTSGVWRSVFFTLAVMALVLKIAVPPGTMVSQSRSSIPLVICTGHGPLVIGDHGQPGAPSKSRADAPCAFASSATPATPAPAVIVAARIAVAIARLPGPDGFDLSTGRGLAAPPPPSHAPPEVPELT
jgi:hypothetical protein